MSAATSTYTTVNWERIRQKTDRICKRLVREFHQGLETLREFKEKDWPVLRDKAIKQSRAFYEGVKPYVANPAKINRDLKEHNIPERVEAFLLRAGYRMAEGVHNLSEQTMEHLDRQLVIKTGRTYGPGGLVCQQCGKTFRMKRQGRIPPCPGCAGTRFHRTF